MPLKRNLLLSLTLISLASQNALAAECSAKSGKTIVPLLELYTSEGCSSCPPADQWLSNLKLGPDKITPLAFHVDYWDYIGWKDRFAKTTYSDRQRRIAAFGGAGFVYTPQFTFNGRDFRSWNESRLRQGIESSSNEAARADLALNFSETNGEVLLKTSAQSSYPEDARQADIFIAIYENKLSSQVNAGENNGRELKHDYVVREFLGPYQFDGKNTFSKAIPLKPEWKGRNAGAVIFVQNRRNGNVLQSLQLPLCI